MSDDWLSAVEALKLVATVTNSGSATRSICSRAHAGLIKAKAARFVRDHEIFDDADIPEEFWSANGEAALKQNWTTGDFETRIGTRHNWKAYGVSFSRAGIESLIGPAVSVRDVPPDPPAQSGGRLPAAWWDDLWVEICRQLFVGDLKPRRQRDIESAMSDWASKRGHYPAPSTVRVRARKLWAAIKEDEN